MKTAPKNTPKSKWDFILALVILAIFIVGYFLNEKLNDKKDVIAKSSEALKRAKEMLANLPESEDTYHLKEVFTTAEVVPAFYNGKGMQGKMEPGKQYCIVFFLPETQEDYEKFGGPENSTMYTGTDYNSISSLPNYVIINPKKMKEFKNDGVSLDYIASVMIHETIHVYQRSLLLRQGQKVSYSLEAVRQREMEAYTFQANFISQILRRNGIHTKIPVPIFHIKNVNKESLYNLCEEVDRLNGYKLGPLASLIVFSAYPEQYVSVANILYVE